MDRTKENVVDIKLTYKCNNSCTLCCQDRELRRNCKELDRAKVNSILVKMEDKKNTSVILTGGEPTLHSDIVGVVKDVKSKGINNIQLQTNGRKLSNRNFLGQLIDAGVNSFGISLHGHTKEIHEKFSNTPDSFDEAIKALTLLKEYKVFVGVNIVISKYNIDTLDKVAEIVKSNQLAQSLQFALIHITGHAVEHQELLVSMTQASNAVKDIIRTYGSNDFKIYSEAIPFCFMAGFEKNVAELYSNDYEITVYDYLNELKFSEIRKENLRDKGDVCKYCLFDTVCEGPWEDYPKYFGWDEFKPRRDI